MYSVLALLVSFYCAYSFISMKELSKFSMQIDCCSTCLYFLYSYGKNLISELQCNSGLTGLIIPGNHLDTSCTS